MDEGQAVGGRARWATDQELENSRPLFEQLYKKHKLTKVMEIMESEHGIRATSVHFNRK